VTSSTCPRHVICTAMSDGNVDRPPRTFQISDVISGSDPCELNSPMADHVITSKAVTSFVTFKSPDNVQIAPVDNDVTVSSVEAVDCSPVQTCSVDLIRHTVVIKE